MWEIYKVLFLKIYKFVWQRVNIGLFLACRVEPRVSNESHSANPAGCELCSKPCGNVKYIKLIMWKLTKDPFTFVMWRRSHLLWIFATLPQLGPLLVTVFSQQAESCLSSSLGGIMFICRVFDGLSVTLDKLSKFDNFSNDQSSMDGYLDCFYFWEVQQTPQYRLNSTRLNCWAKEYVPFKFRQTWQMTLQKRFQ